MRVEQILKNLLSNALKFTESGGVTVKLRRAAAARGRRPRGGGAPTSWPSSVTDTGLGVPTDKQEWIFEAFAQVDGGTSRKFGGTGLGLAIAKQLAVRLGGDLRVDSDGTERQHLHPLPAARRRPRRPGRPRRPPRPDPVSDARRRAVLRPGEPCLLIIDDDQTFGDVVLGMAREAGFKAWSRPRARRGWPWPAATARAASSWTWACPTWTAGR